MLAFYAHAYCGRHIMSAAETRARHHKAFDHFVGLAVCALGCPCNSIILSPSLTKCRFQRASAHTWAAHSFVDICTFDWMFGSRLTWWAPHTRTILEHAKHLQLKFVCIFIQNALATLKHISASILYTTYVYAYIYSYIQVHTHMYKYISTYEREKTARTN